MDFDLVERLVWKWGGRRDFWVRNAKVIDRFIATQKPELVTSHVSGSAGLEHTAMPEERAIYLKRPPFPGGLRIPHLHHENDVYALTDEQWKTFSTQVMKEFQAKLTTVKAVNFEQVMTISQAIDHLV